MIAFTLLLVQGLSELVKRLAIMRDLIPDPHGTSSAPSKPRSSTLSKPSKNTERL